jgi:CO/xanthine dehydrogenase FAD-binding subunit
VATAPLPVPGAEAVLVGSALGEDAIAEAAAIATTTAKPMDALDLPPSYRKRTIATHVMRALRELRNAPF